MKRPLKSLFSLCIAVLSINAHAGPKNILLICVDDLRPELNSFGADYIISPNIDKLASKGRSFHNNYVNAPSCGPSRYTLLTGRYGPPANDALFLRSKKIAAGDTSVQPSMPEWFRQNGYTTVSVGKVSHHPGGRGGADWDDPSVIEMPEAWDRHLMPVGEWQHPRGAMHGLAHGEIRVNAGEMDLFQAKKGDDSIYPDGIIVDEALKQLKSLASDKEKPFFLAVGIIRPHLPFGAPKKYLDLYKDVELPQIPYYEKPLGTSSWHKSGEFMKYNRWGKDPRNDYAFATEVRRHYAACVSYADAQVGKILKKLKKTGADKNTIVVLWGDHGWNLGEHAIWGKHNLFEEALRSPLIIAYPGINAPGADTNAIVEGVDLFPTLCELSEITQPTFSHGVSLAPILKNPNAKGHTAIAYRQKMFTLRTDTHRIITHPNGEVELYDHTSAEKEAQNVAAQNPRLVKKLKAQLAAKIAKR